MGNTTTVKYRTIGPDTIEQQIRTRLQPLEELHSRLTLDAKFPDVPGAVLDPDQLRRVTEQIKDLHKDLDDVEAQRKAERG